MSFCFNPALPTDMLSIPCRFQACYRLIGARAASNNGERFKQIKISEILFSKHFYFYEKCEFYVIYMLKLRPA